MDTIEFWKQGTSTSTNAHLFECMAHNVLVSVWSTIMWQRPNNEASWPIEECRDTNYTQPVYRHTFAYVYRLRKDKMPNLQNIDPTMLQIGVEDIFDIYTHFAKLYADPDDANKLREDFNYKFARILVNHMGYIYDGFKSKHAAAGDYPNSVLDAKIELNVCEITPIYKEFDVETGDMPEPELETLQVTIAGDLVYDSAGTAPDKIEKWTDRNDGSRIYTDWFDALIRTSAVKAAPVEQIQPAQAEASQTPEQPVQTSIETLTAVNRDILSLIFLTEKVKKMPNSDKYRPILDNANNIINYYIESINKALKNTGG